MNPELSVLPIPQKQLWAELGAVPDTFVLYGGTALALRLAHRSSVDFDFFSPEKFQPDELQHRLPFAENCEILQSASNTLTVLVDRGGPVKVSFFGNLTFGQAQPPDIVSGPAVKIASVADIFATKLKTILQRSEAKDYLDIAAIVKAGVSLETGLGYARAIYGDNFNTLLPLKAVCYFEDGDLHTLPRDVRDRLTEAASAVREIPLARCHSRRIGTVL